MFKDKLLNFKKPEEFLYKKYFLVAIGTNY